MCVCDLSFKCVCAIWEGYILNPPARGWSSPYRRHLPLSPCSPVSLCHLVQLTCSPVHLVTPGHVWSCLVTSGHLFTWSPGYLFTSGHLVAWLPCCLVTWSRCAVICSHLRAFHLRAHLFDLPCFPIRPRQIHLYCASLLVFILVSILSSLALILQALSFFWQDYSFSFYSQRPSGHCRKCNAGKRWEK